MLGVGIDWAEEFHLVALGRPGEGVVEVARVEHTPATVAALVAQIATLEPDPAEVRVVIETRHGLLVEALVDAGYTVLPVNPDLVARRRGPAKKKDDAEDARIACLLALDRFTELRALVPHGELAGELRAIARDDVRAARDERRLLNRLRADLAATFPAALTFAGDKLGSPVVLKLLQRWPTADELAAAGRDEIEALARQAKHGWPHRLADRVAQAMAGDHFRAKDYLVRAKADTIRLACAQLLLLREQRRAWEKRMGELLLGDRRRGRAEQPGDQLVVASRLACNRYLADAVQQWAFTSLRTSGWAREFYDTQRSRGRKHHAALRALGNRWLEVLWHCLTKGVPYDESVHVANRNRALGRVNEPAKLAA